MKIRLEELDEEFVWLLRRRLERRGIPLEKVVALAQSIADDLAHFGYPPETFVAMAEDALSQEVVPIESARLARYFDQAEAEIDGEGWIELEVVRYFGANGRYTLIARDDEGTVYRRKFDDGFEGWFHDRRRFLASVCESVEELAEAVDAPVDLKGRRFLGKIEERRLNGSERVIETIVDFRRLPKGEADEVDDDEIPF